MTSHIRYEDVSTIILYGENLFASKLLFSIIEDTRALGQEGTRIDSEIMLKI